MKMHDGELDIDLDLVSDLVATQFPHLAGLPIEQVRSTGTVNAIFRIGDDLYARLPRMETGAEDLRREWRWLPQLSPHLSLPVPVPVSLGRPDDTYPFFWAIYAWIDGRPYAADLVHDEQVAAEDLARFVLELRRIDTAEAPRAGRRPLRELDAITRDAIRSARGLIDGEAALEAWDRALEAPAWAGTPVWIHTDLLRPNVLVRAGRIGAVIDFGGAGIGDPAADVIAAWSVFGSTGRSTFRDALEVDDGTWNRARGFALHQAAVIIPYYSESNPDFVASTQRTVYEVLADVRLG